MAWASFRADVVPVDRHCRNSRRYIRSNPDLDRIAPSVDAKDELRSLQMTVKKRLSLPHCMTAVQHVADRLIATSFFLDVQNRSVLGDGTHSFVCAPLCKFDDHSANLRGLGRLLCRATTQGFRPYFLIKGDAHGGKGMICEFPMASIERMANEAIFEVPKMNVIVGDDRKASNVTLVLSPHDGLEPEGFSLSGFPKVLATSVPQEDLLLVAEAPLRTSTSHQSLLFLAHLDARRQIRHLLAQALSPWTAQGQAASISGHQQPAH
ncbi:hypothetical protein LTR36_007854 [Oleoguttula mirabilis]|uniref:Uncharacterized protein n=1 Tax=Oleoguttula mirabilis TaxID=1507867 RepID=A0AAV9J8Y2_9PEZI|nr:hypothetical protein LTR36_007854 [Oleoguttula mirabilis]